jgi:hypothetical protein
MHLWSGINNVRIFCVWCLCYVGKRDANLTDTHVRTTENSMTCVVGYYITEFLWIGEFYETVAQNITFVSYGSLSQMGFITIDGV